MASSTVVSEQYLVAIYVVYGMSFILLGVSALLHPVDQEMPVSHRFWLLGAFGLLHGCGKWVEAWIIATQSADIALTWAGALLAAASFLPLFEFARRAAKDWALSRAAVWQQLASIRIYVPIILLLLVLAALSTDRAAALTAAAHHLLGFPGAVGAGLALASRLSPPIAQRTDQILARILGGALMIYGVLAGLITGSVADWPAWRPTAAGFASATGLPLQPFRALCAFTAMVAMIWLVRRRARVTLRRERRSAAELKNVNRALEARVEERTSEQREGLELLRREREFANMLIDAAPAIVVLVSPQGLIQRVNPYFERLSGYRLDEILGKDWTSTFLPERDHERIRKLLLTATGGTPTKGNVNPIVTRDGAEREIEWYDTTIRDSGGKVISLLAIGHDITDRKRMEAELATLLRRTESILGSISDGFFTLNREWVYTYVNEKAAQFVGKTPDQLINRRIWDLFPAAENSIWHQRYQQVMDSGEVAEIVDYYDELRRWYAATIYPYEGGVSVYFHDVTDEQALARDLRVNGARLAEIQRIARIGSWELDVATEHVSIDEIGAEIYGLDRSTYGGDYESFISLVHPDDRERVREIDRKSVETGCESEQTYRIVGRDGGIRYLAERSAPRYDDTGRRVSVRGTVQDVTEQHRVEAALRASEASLRRDHRMARLGHWLMRYGPDGRWQNAITMDSPEFNEIIGAKSGVPAQTVGDFVNRFVHPDDCAAYKQALDRLANPDIAGYVSEHRILQPDGSIVFVHEIGESSFDANGRLVSASGVSQDVTEQRRAEIALRASQTLLEMGQRLANMGSFEWYMTGGRWIWSHQMWRIHGLEPQAAAPVDDVYMQLLHPDDRQKYRDVETRLRATNEPYEFDYRITRGDGEERILHETGFVVPDEPGHTGHVFGTAQDVTEQRRNEATLRERENLLRQGARLGRFGTWVWDVTKDRCLVCSEELAALFGMTVEEFMREKGSDRQIRGELWTGSNAVAEDVVIPEGGLSYEDEFRAAIKGDELRYFREVGQSFRSETTGKIWCVGVTQDITESKSAETELRRLVEESSRLARLAEQANQAKSEFLATMSHELRTPLNAIIGFSEMLLNFGNNIPSEKTHDYHATILQSGKHLLNLINDILDLARVESGKLDLDFENVALPTLVDECISYLEPSARRNAISFQVDVPEIEISIDRRLLKQLLINVLSNAMKFNREDGTIRVKARRHADAVVIDIEDTGIGMDEEEIVRALEPFVQIESSYRRTREGTGLGLALVQRFTALLGGNLEIRSARNVGTTVTIELPVQDAA